MRQKAMGMILSGVMALSSMTTTVSAATETKAKDVIQGEYVAVVNTGLTKQKTGVLLFDETITEPKITTQTDQSNLIAIDQDVLYQDMKQGIEKAGRAVNSTVYSVGQTKSFYQGKTFVCITVGTESYVWMEKSLYDRYSVDNRTLAGQEVAELYEGRPLEVIRELTKDKDLAALYQDGTGKLSILIEELSGSTGYYAGEEGVTAIHINAIAPDKYVLGAYGKYDGLLVHEMQHAIFRWFACNGDKNLAYELSWLNEGLSVAAMDYYWGGDDPTGWLSLINGNLAIRNGSSLAYSDYRQSSALDYSMPDLFIRYLAAQKEKAYQPVEMIRSFYNNQMAKGQTIHYMNQVLQDAKLTGENGALTFEEAITNFYAAAFAQQNDGTYGFYGDSVVRKIITDYPVYAGNSGEEVSLEGTAGIILKTKNGEFTIPENVGSNIRFIAFNKNDKPKLPAKGSGSESDPYQITTAGELAAMTLAEQVSYKLMNDLDVSTSILFPASSFSGTFDGNGRTITGMTKPLVINNQGTIKNLTVDGFHGAFKTWTGVLSNFNAGVIMDCVVTGDINVTLTSAKAFNLPAFGTMTGQNEMSGIITRCYSDADIALHLPENSNYAGMIAGINKYQITDCYAQGSLTITNAAGAKINAGGIVGEQFSSIYPKPTLEHCYSTTAIQVTGGVQTLGQLAGYIQPESTMSSCYGITGIAAVGNGRTEGAKSESSEAMKQMSTYSGWRFGSVWEMPFSGYPQFTQPASITAKLSKTQYYIGESLNFFQAELLTDNGSVPLLENMLEPFDSSTAGEKILKGSYRGMPFELKVNVKAPGNVSFLEVYGKPKTSYAEGDTFDPTGTRLRATIDGSTNIYITSGYTIDQQAGLTSADSMVVYHYGNASAELPITVQPAKVKSLMVLHSPNKLAYYHGDVLSLEGLKVQIIYDNGARSAAFEYDELTANNIHFSRGTNEAILDGRILSASDDSQMLYVYYGDKLPSASGSVAASFGQLIVKQNLYLSDQVLDVTVNEYNSVWSDEIQGSEGDITAALIKGTLPIGLTAKVDWYDTGYAMKLEGTPTQVIKEPVDVIYELTDSVSGKKTQVHFIIRVNEQVCGIEQFKVSASITSNEYYYGKIDEQAGTIDIVVPPHVNKGSLWCVITGKKGTDTSNLGSKTLDLSTSLTLETSTLDGKKKKNYTVMVYSSYAEKLASPTNLTWNKGAASWTEVEHASGYIVGLYDRDQMLIEQHQVSNTNYDFGEAIQRKGSYSFLVTAYSSDSSLYRDSDSVRSSRLQYEAPEIRSITLDPVQAELKPGATQQFLAALAGIGNYRKDIQWTISGNSSSTTSIVNGLLTIGTDETAAEINVRATSLANQSIYAAAIITIDPLQPLAKPTQLSWAKEIGSWTQVAGADGYKVSLWKNGMMLGEIQDITTNTKDFSAEVIEDADYSFRVRAFGKGFLESEEIESPIYHKMTELKLTSIKVKQLPATLSYYPGEAFDPAGLILELGYQDGSSKTVSYTKETAAGFTFTPAIITEKLTAVTIAYGGLNTDVSIKVLDKMAPVIDDFIISNKEVVYHKDAKEASVSLKEGINGMGAVTITYNGSSEKPVLAGEYQLAINVTEGIRYSALSDIDAGKFIIHPKQLAATEISTIVPMVKQDSLADNAMVNGQSYNLSGKGICEGDRVAVVGDLRYPSTKTPGLFTDAAGAVLTTTQKLSNDNYTLAIGTSISGIPYEVVNKELRGIYIASNPSKTTYFVGDAFDQQGLVVKAEWEYGEDSDISNQIHIKTDALLKEDSTVIIEYRFDDQFITKQIAITMIPIQLEALEVSGSPLKSEYIEGTSFDPSGLIVTARYNDSRKNKDVTRNCVYTPALLSLNDTQIHITYTDASGTKTTSVSGIKVKAKSLTNISIKQQPVQGEYKMGEAFDPSGLILNLNYDNGTSDSVVYQSENADEFTFLPQKLVMGINTISVGYQGFTTTVTIVVKPVVYDILEGGNMLWTIDKDLAGFVIKSEGAFDKFVEVRIDGAVIDVQNYTASKGSTMITLKPAYLRTLSLGSHTVQIVFVDGESNATIVIDKALGEDVNVDQDQPETNKPETDQTDKEAGQNKPSNKETVDTKDNTNIMLPLLLFFGSMSMMAAIARKKRKWRR